jgi:catalase
MHRVILCAIAVVALVASFAPRPVAAEEARSEGATAEQLVDALNAIFGQKNVRASHAKGICVTGAFAPAADAASLSKAPFLNEASDVLGRFSIGGGDPKASDKVRGARGLALRFDPDGENLTDVIFINSPMHFARNPDQMLGFLMARAPAEGGKPDAAKVKAFAEANPETARQAAFVAARPVPASYATVSYWAVHAFPVETADGARAHVKFKLLPKAGDVGLKDEEIESMPDDFLRPELEKRVASAPAKFDLVAIVGQEGDPLDDVTASWPEEERKQVTLGVLQIKSIADDAVCDATIFDPTNMPEGMSAPADALFGMRSPAYAVSATRRAN